MSLPFLPPEASHTPHGEQLQAGFRALRFAPALEAEYRAVSLHGLAHARLVAVLVAAAIWLLFVAIDLARLDQVRQFPDWPPVLWQLAFIRALVLLALVACALRLWRAPGRIHPLTAVVSMFFVLIVGSAAAIAIYRLLHAPHEPNVLALVAMAIFLPLGLRFFEALALALVCILAVMLVGLAMLEGPGRDTFMRLPFVLLIATAVSAVGAYLREYAQREQFLLRRELEWQAMRDPLTALFNRRVFHRHLDTAIRQWQPGHGTVVLVMLDVDHFKLYNDTYGHQAGDVALRRLAGVLDELAPGPQGLAFRTGGEEMAMILQCASADEAHAVCERLLQDVHQLHIVHDASSASDRLSVSAGLAVLGPNESAEALYRRADQLLYRAKASGRNCVALGPDPDGQVLRGG